MLPDRCNEPPPSNPSPLFLTKLHIIFQITKSSLNTLGVVGVALIFIIVVFSLARVVYTLWKIYS